VFSIGTKIGNAEFAGVDIAGVDKSARCGKGGHCRSGQCGTMWQGRTMREWTMQEWSNACEKFAQDKLKVTDCEINSHVISSVSSRFRT